MYLNCVFACVWSNASSVIAAEATVIRFCVFLLDRRLHIASSNLEILLHALLLHQWHSCICSCHRQAPRPPVRSSAVSALIAKWIEYGIQVSNDAHMLRKESFFDSFSYLHNVLCAQNGEGLRITTCLSFIPPRIRPSILTLFISAITIIALFQETSDT